MDKVRVLRLIVYEGDRDWVEETVAKSVHGTKIIANNKLITVTTIGEFPEIMQAAAELDFKHDNSV